MSIDTGGCRLSPMALRLYDTFIRVVNINYHERRRLSEGRAHAASCAVKTAPGGAPATTAHRGHPRGPAPHGTGTHATTHEVALRRRDEISRPRARAARAPARATAPRAQKTHIAVRVCVQCADERPDRTRCARRARLIGLSAPASFVSRLNSPLMWLRTVPSCGPPTSPRVGPFSRDRYHQPNSFATAACPCALGVLLCPCRPARRPSRRRRLRHHR